MRLLKQVYFDVYQKGMFYVGQFAGEYGKAGRFVNEAVTIVTLLTVKGFNISVWWIIPCYLLLLIIAALIGKCLTVIGVIDYNNGLANKYNPEIMEIVDWVREQKKKEQKDKKWMESFDD